MSRVLGAVCCLVSLLLAGCVSNTSPTNVTIHSAGEREAADSNGSPREGSLAEVRDSVVALHDKVTELCEHLATLEREAAEEEQVSDRSERTCRHVPQSDAGAAPAAFEEPIGAQPLVPAEPARGLELPDDARVILENAIIAQKQALAVIANNLANASTTGFKKERVNFEDLYYRRETLPGAIDSAGQTTSVGVAIGLGSRVSGTQTYFNQGAFQQTGRQLDVAIAGHGFFQVQDPSGQVLYTRAGDFSINANGQFVLGSASTGRVLDPAITIPQDAVNVVISSTGSIQVQQANNPQLQSAGQIQLALFLNREGLLKVGENLFAQTDASGAPQQVNPGSIGGGLIRQNMLEMSNVDAEAEEHAWHSARARLRQLRSLLPTDK